MSEKERETERDRERNRRHDIESRDTDAKVKREEQEINKGEESDERRERAKIRLCSRALHVLLVEVPDHRRAVVEGFRSTKSQIGRWAAGDWAIHARAPQ